MTRARELLGLIEAKKKMELIKYDVWGNEEEGWEINQAFFTGKFYEVDPSVDNDLIVRNLQEQGLLKPGISVKDLEIEGDGETVLYFADAENGKPEFELRVR